MKYPGLVSAIRDKAADLFESKELGDAWGGIRPVDLFDDADGLERVMILLIRLEYGVYT
jgi:uncharacterized protein (DUF2384 family)